MHKVNTIISQPYGSKVTISIIGAGGTGSILIATLARLNQAIMRLSRTYLDVQVFDPDRITENNVTRQVYSPADIGRHKSVALCQRINRFYSTNWTGYPYQWQIAPELVRSNLIITCTDTAKSRMELAPLLKEWNDTTNHPKKFVYWMDIGNTMDTGNVILGGYGARDRDSGMGYHVSPDEFVEGNWQKKVDGEPYPRLPYVTDLYDLKEHEEVNPDPSCSLAESLGHQHIMVNDLCAKVAACLFWDLFTKEYIDWRAAFIKLSTLNIKKIKV